MSLSRTIKRAAAKKSDFSIKTASDLIQCMMIAYGLDSLTISGFAGEYDIDIVPDNGIFENDKDFQDGIYYITLCMTFSNINKLQAVQDNGIKITFRSGTPDEVPINKKLLAKATTPAKSLI